MAKATDNKHKTAEEESDQKPAPAKTSGDAKSTFRPAPRNAEEAAFQKSQEENYDPNKLENPYPRAMNREEAERVVKSYGDFKGAEVPNDLQQARKVLGEQ